MLFVFILKKSTVLFLLLLHFILFLNSSLHKNKYESWHKYWFILNHLSINKMTDLNHENFLEIWLSIYFMIYCLHNTYCRFLIFLKYSIPLFFSFVSYRDNIKSRAPCLCFKFRKVCIYWFHPDINSSRLRYVRLLRMNKNSTDVNKKPSIVCYRPFMIVKLINISWKIKRNC